MFYATQKAERTHAVAHHSTTKENIRRTTAVALEAIGYETASVENRTAALKQLRADNSTLPFWNLKLNGGERPGFAAGIV